MLSYDEIDVIASYLKVSDNDKIEALCDAFHVPKSWSEQIKINNKVLLHGVTLCNSCRNQTFGYCTCAIGLIVEYQTKLLFEKRLIYYQLSEYQRKIQYLHSRKKGKKIGEILYEVIKDSGYNVIETLKKL